MQITEVKIFKTDKGNLKAFASVTFDKSFIVTGLKVMEGNNGLFVAMPSQKVKEEYKDTCFPITKEFRDSLISAVLMKYNEGQQDFYPADESESDLPF